jgi:hypothetical protein
MEVMDRRAEGMDSVKELAWTRASVTWMRAEGMDSVKELTDHRAEVAGQSKEIVKRAAAHNRIADEVAKSERDENKK